MRQVKSYFNVGMDHVLEVAADMAEYGKGDEGQARQLSQIMLNYLQMERDVESFMSAANIIIAQGAEDAEEGGLVKRLKREVTEQSRSNDDAALKEHDRCMELQQKLWDSQHPGKGRRLFSVRGLNKATTKLNQAMRFDGVEINDGGHFSADTGTFTAPHAGLYFFTAAVRGNNKDTAVYGHIMVDNVQHCAVHGSYYGGSGSVMVPLTAGQTVWVKAVSPVDQYSGLYDWYGWNRFSGTLVLPFP